MTTLTLLKADIADDLARTDLTSAIAGSITNAIKFYQEHVFYFNYARDVNFDTVAGQEFYTIDDDVDIGRLITPQKAYIDTDYILTHELNSAVRPAGDSRSRPTWYVWENDTISLYPIADAAYAVSITGHVKIDAPATDEEADNEWMVEAYDLIRSRAIADIYARKVRDYPASQFNKALEKDELDRLNRETSRRFGTGFIRPTQF